MREACERGRRVREGSVCEGSVCEREACVSARAGVWVCLGTQIEWTVGILNLNL